MNIYIKHDHRRLFEIVLKEQFELLNVDYKLSGMGEINIADKTTKEQFKSLTSALSRYGIEIVDSQKSTLVQKIKDAIIEMVWDDGKLPASKISYYLSKKLNHSYGYLSNLFSEITYTSIENYIILQKIERTKKMILEDEMTLTEISYHLNYSSVAHLSSQFKKTTGITPSTFMRVVNKRKLNLANTI